MFRLGDLSDFRGNVINPWDILQYSQNFDLLIPPLSCRKNGQIRHVILITNVTFQNENFQYVIKNGQMKLRIYIIYISSFFLAVLCLY